MSVQTHNGVRYVPNHGLMVEEGYFVSISLIVIFNLLNMYNAIVCDNSEIVYLHNILLMHSGVPAHLIGFNDITA